MKLGRLFTYEPPIKFASDYSEDERERFKRSFQPAAQNYRRISKSLIWIFLSLALLFLIFFVLGINGFLPQKLVGRFALVWIVLLGIFIFTVLILAVKYDPICPACQKGVDRVLKTFCPECGSKRLDRGGFFAQAHCLSCGKMLSFGKGRRPKVKFCTHCGVCLDDKGI